MNHEGLPVECSLSCGDCSIVISISLPIPGMPDDKPAGVRCINLTDDYRCALFGSKLRPKVCDDFLPEPGICGSSREEAMRIMENMERGTVGKRGC